MSVAADKVGKLIEPWRKGQSLTADRLNHTVDAVNRLVEGTPFGKQISDVRPVPVPSTAIRVRYVSQTDNYLVVKKINADNSEGATIEIAKPFGIQVQTWNGKVLNGWTYAKVTASERTATSGSNTESQVITPAYFVGMPDLTAVPVADDFGLAATGVTGSDGSTILNLMQFTAQEWAEKFVEA